MNKELAKRMLLMVNDMYTVEVLNEYIEDRIGRLHKSLESAIDTSVIYNIQGQIKVLRDLMSLKEEVRAVAYNT